MHLNPYGEYAILLVQSLANDWPTGRAGVVARTREFGVTMPFPELVGDHEQCRQVVDDWLTVVDARCASRDAVRRHRARQRA